MTITSNGVVTGPPPGGIPHLVIPFAIGDDGTAQTVPQGSVAEIVQCVANLVGTTPGTRYLVPTYGTPDPTFAGINRKALGLAVATFEPRATVTVVESPGGTEFVEVRVAGSTA